MGFGGQSVAQSTTGRALANWNGGAVMVERVAGASRDVRAAGCGKVSQWGRHRNASGVPEHMPGSMVVGHARKNRSTSMLIIPRR
jgi:hypothetical protein